MKTTKEPVHIRQKKLANGNISLYLDIYVEGVRKYEFLKLYLSGKREDKEKDKQTLQLANAIKARRIVEIQNGIHGFKTSKSKVNFLDFAAKVFNEKKDPEYYSFVSKLLSNFCLKERIVSFDDFTTEKISELRNEIEKSRYSENSKKALFRIIKHIFAKAEAEEVIKDNPSRKFKGFSTPESTRMYLTLDEVRRLSETEGNDRIKRPFLFSCLTGIRGIDLKNMKWRDVQTQGKFTRLIFMQQKTSGQEYIDINDQARALMGERKGDDENVFDLPTKMTINRHLAIWTQKAGINKKITFHCARHTFATMMLELGTDIYTVSKLLGHRDVTTTQIYTKVIDKSKQEAVSHIPQIL